MNQDLPKVVECVHCGCTVSDACFYTGPSPAPCFAQGFSFYAAPCDEKTARMFIEQLQAVGWPSIFVQHVASAYGVLAVERTAGDVEKTVTDVLEDLSKGRVDQAQAEQIHDAAGRAVQRHEKTKSIGRAINR